MSLAEALEKNKLFICDLEITEGLPHKDNAEVSYFNVKVTSSVIFLRDVLFYWCLIVIYKLLFFVFQLASPFALFYLNKEDKLLPVAIQLKQQGGADNPVSIMFTLWL